MAALTWSFTPKPAYTTAPTPRCSTGQFIALKLDAVIVKQANLPSSPASNREELEELATLHGELRRRAKDLFETKDIGTEYRWATEAAEALTKELDRVSNLATFPGRCELNCG